ncbi:MAG: hypothetical protein HC915_15660 [Anaerolineae bacterium]|nr:hypothetical protein [Anaerolineae bacterium]
MPEHPSPNATEATPVAKQLMMYAHPACPMLPPVAAQLRLARVPYQYINIYQDHTARELVRQVNHGYESVPTLVFPDGSTLTEPSAGALRRKLQEQGYSVPWTAWLAGNLGYLVIATVILFSVLSFLEVI